MARVVVIGGGISGLAAAYRIRQSLPTAHITLLEAATHPGGNIRSFQDEGYLWEAGPNGFLDSKPDTLQLCHELRIDDQLIGASEESRKHRYLCLQGRLIALPASPLRFLTTKALSFQGKIALLGEPLRRPRRSRAHVDEESVHEFAVRRFGSETADTLVDALVTGIWGGNTKELSLAAAFPRLAKYEAEAGSVFRGFWRSTSKRARLWSFRGGMQTLTDALAASLQAELRLNTTVTRLEVDNGQWKVHGKAAETWLADAVILTVPAPVQAKLLGSIDRGIAREFEAIPYNRIAVVALGYCSSDVPIHEGFGYIAPQNSRRDVLGVQWCSSIFPGRAPQDRVLWRALVGGVHRAELLDFDDAALISRVHREMQTVLNVTGVPVFARVHRWPRAIPQYVLSHLGRVSRIEETASRYPGLFVGGNALHGIAINDCTGDAKRLAERVGRFLQSR